MMSFTYSEREFRFWRTFYSWTPSRDAGVTQLDSCQLVYKKKNFGLVRGSINLGEAFFALGPFLPCTYRN